MLKVALMRTSNPEDPYQLSLPPLGVGYLIAYARREVADCEFRYCHSREELLEFKPNLLAVSSASENFNEAVALAALAKEELNIPSVAGGMHVTALPQALPDEFAAAVLGEGEQTFAELLKLLQATGQLEAGDLSKIDGLAFHEGGRVRVTGVRPVLADLDQLPWPDRQALGDRWLKPSWQQVHMISSRGCPYDCAFCASGRHGQGVRFFSVDYALRELEALRLRYNPLEIYFFDDLMVVNRRRFLELCQALEERGLHQGVVFRAYARVDLLDEELADWFARCNFRSIDFGFESNSLKVLEYLNKRRATPEKNQRAIDLLRERQLSVGASMIVGSRPESCEDALESVRFIERNREALDRLAVGVMTLIPGTRVWDEAVERGVVDEGLDWSLLGFNSRPEEKQDLSRFPLMLEAMTREDLGGFYRRFQDLAREINARGEARFWTEQFQSRQARAVAAESELSALKGSRLVRAAWKVRNLLRGSS